MIHLSKIGPVKCCQQVQSIDHWLTDHLLIQNVYCIQSYFLDLRYCSNLYDWRYWSSFIASSLNVSPSNIKAYYTLLLKVFLKSMGSWFVSNSFLPVLNIDEILASCDFPQNTLFWETVCRNMSSWFLNPSFPMHPFSNLSKHQKVVKFSDVLRGRERVH